MHRYHNLLSLIACLVSVLVLTGSALPVPRVWSCHHATRVVAAAQPASAMAMPCRMAGAMAAMACCPAPMADKSAGRAARHQAVGRPYCQPVLIPLAQMPAARDQAVRVHIRLLLAANTAFGALFQTSPARAQGMEMTRLRPPPSDGLHRRQAFGLQYLRAPPVA